MDSEMKHKNITLPDAKLVYYPTFLNLEAADSYLRLLLNTLEWEQHHIKLFGKTIPQPRLTALYALNSLPYSYSGLQLNPLAYTNELQAIHSMIENLTGCVFTHCLANLYRDGSDSMGWHSDNEKELGKDPQIASFSLGGVRSFQLKHKTISGLKHAIPLEHGSLLLMKGKMQEFWKHQLPKTSQVVSPRINLTFRKII